MKLKTSFIRTAGVAILVTMVSWPLTAQENEQVFGRELMTQTELQEHRNTMSNLNTNAERAQYRQQHHERMLQRARENGVKLKNGMGQGSGKGMGNGQGMGAGQGMGTGMGSGQGMGTGMGSGTGMGAGGNGKSQKSGGQSGGDQ
jgi:Ca2+-dependent lipid-binding protein